MAIEWRAEACDLAPDPHSGARITRLTAAAMHHTNLYFEQPHVTPDSRRVAFSRATHGDPRLPPTELCVADLERKRIASIDPDVVSTWFATSPWSGLVHYLRANGELIRVDLATLEKTIVLTHWPIAPPVTLWSVTSDMRQMIIGRPRGAANELCRVDLSTGEVTTIWYDPPLLLNHVQIDPHTDRNVLVQVNRPENGATHGVLDLYTGALHTFPVGEPHTCLSTGHATWLGDTGRMATPVHWPGMPVDFAGTANTPAHDYRHPTGNLVIAGIEDTHPQIFSAPEHLFNHASSSRCGRYVVTESFRHGIPGPVEIVICDIHSGGYATLIADTGSSGGAPACAHVHAFFTADTRRVIYNADPLGLSHLHVADIPDGFLAALG